MKQTTMLAVLLLGGLAVPIFAQDYDQGDDPDHGVARLSLLDGDVAVRRGDTGETIAGEINAPLVPMDHVLTGPGSRAEVQFDWANMIRLGPTSEVRIGQLGDNNYLVQVAQGTTTFRVLRDTRAQVEISTPTVSLRPMEKGEYRITIEADGTTEITVRSGQAEVLSAKGSEILGSNRMMEATGTPDNPEFMVTAAEGRDDWDRWNAQRDRDLERGLDNYQYVSRDEYGADDLNGYGRWVYDNPYGYVWVPTVTTVDWAPYRVGRWAWVNYYGWTWVSGDPWGWAPYHYGRWYSSPYGWAWYPGPVVQRQYWRPALVGFFGWGSGGVSVGLGVGFGFGNVGWVPLAPREVYRPWYGRGYNRTTIVTNVNIINNYQNARQINGRAGVTGIQANNFGHGRVSNDNFVRVSAGDLAQSHDVRQVSIDSTRDSRRFSDREASSKVVASSLNRQFASRAALTRANVNAAPTSSNNRSRRDGVVGAGSAVAQGNSNRRPSQNPNVAQQSGNNSILEPRGVRADSPTTSGNNPGNNSGNSANPRPTAPAPASNNSRGRFPQPQQPVQINPPIVRERGFTPPPQVQQPRSAPAPMTPRAPSAPAARPAPAAPPSGGSHPAPAANSGAKTEHRR